MSRLRYLLSNLLPVVASLLITAVPLAVLVAAGDYLRPLWLRFIYQSDPNGGHPPQEAFDRIRREQEDIASGVERGPIRCMLRRWTEGGDNPPDLRLDLTKKSAAPVTLWYPAGPEDHVTFLVHDRQGKAVGSFAFGSRQMRPVALDPKTGLAAARRGRKWASAIPAQ